MTNKDIIKARLKDLLNVINMDSKAYIKTLENMGIKWDDEFFNVDSFKLEDVKTLIRFLMEDIENDDI